MAPLQVVVAIIIFWQYVGYISLIAIGYTLFLLFLQPVFSRIFVHIRCVSHLSITCGEKNDYHKAFHLRSAKIVKITDQRVKIMSEIMKSMRIVKMYCWESAYVRQTQHIRRYDRFSLF